MGAERIIGRVAEIPPGEGRTFEVEGQRVAVFRTRAGDVFATQAECPHKAGPLADGLMAGATVTCPLHEWVFDLASGRALTGNCTIQVYSVRVTDNGCIVMPHIT